MGKRCHEKIKYPDLASAYRVAMKMRRLGKGQSDIYTCRQCGFYHLTHGKPPPKDPNARID